MVKERRSRFANPVVVVADGDVVARYGLWAESLLVSLVDEGINPMLVTPGETPAALAATIPERAVARFCFPTSRWALVQHWGSRFLVEQLANEPVRLVLSASGHMARYGAWLAEQLGVPLATLVMGEDEVAAAASVSGRLSAAFAGSTPLADQLTRRLGRGKAGSGEGKVVPIELGVHLGAQTAAFSDPARIPAIMTSGRLDFASHFEQFILAAAQLNDRHCEAIYFVVGSGPAERELRQLARQRNLTARMTFVPELRRMENIFDGMDIYVQPYVPRRLDLRLLEAMAAGVVVIARNGGAVDFVRDGVNGVELTNSDEATLTILMQKLLEEPAIGRQLGDQARQFVQANHLAGVTVQRVVERVKVLALRQQTLKIA